MPPIWELRRLAAIRCCDERVVRIAAALSGSPAFYLRLQRFALQDATTGDSFNSAPAEGLARAWTSGPVSAGARAGVSLAEDLLGQIEFALGLGDLMAGRISQIIAPPRVSAPRSHDGFQITDVLAGMGVSLPGFARPVHHHLAPFASPATPGMGSVAPELMAVTPAVVATNGDDNLKGTSGADTIHGLAGNDVISGLGGNDALYGDDGADVVIGGAGADTIDGGTGDDRLYSNLQSPLINAGTVILDRGTDVDTIVGGDGSDTIFAGYGDNVDGGADGYWGDKLYISFQGATAGVHFDAHLATQTIGGGTISGIENISWIEGSNYDDYIDVGTTTSNGYSDQTQIYGMGGSDTLIGSWYTYVLDGGDGSDTINASASANARTVSGGAGDDTIDTSQFSQAVTDGGDGNDTINGNYEIHGGAGDDTIHIIDSFYHGLVTGDAGSDTITGSGFNDEIDGGAGDDALNGDAGNDIIIGGAGNDVLSGGEGNDQFQAGVGNDVITDFSAGDSIVVRGGLSAASVTQAGSDVVVAITPGNQITVENSDVASVEAGMRFELPKPNDVAISTDGSQIYATGADGNLYVYSAADGELLHMWDVGTQLGGIAISADGTFAMVTELQPRTPTKAPTPSTRPSPGRSATMSRTSSSPALQRSTGPAIRWPTASPAMPVTIICPVSTATTC
jgi:Ca2+-binding RTX toxin-like protein